MESESFCVFVFTPSSDGAYSRLHAFQQGDSKGPHTTRCFLAQVVQQVAPSGVRTCRRVPFLTDGYEQKRVNLLKNHAFCIVTAALNF